MPTSCHAIQTMRDRLDAKAVAAQIPMGAEDNFWGIVALVTMTAWDFKADDKGMTYPEPMDAIPAGIRRRDAALVPPGAFGGRRRLRATTSWRKVHPAEEEVSVEELEGRHPGKGVIAFARSTRCSWAPAYKNKGVQELLDAVVDYMPSPVDIPPIKGVNPETGEEEDRPADPKAPILFPGTSRS
ncbi:MAG: hypothetical protein ACLTDR_15075 [Adlercreutzia equolifaciens]